MRPADTKLQAWFAKSVVVILATSAIAKAHEWAGHDSPGRDRGVREALKGWGRQLARPQRQAGALTADVLSVIRLTAPKPRARGRGLETAEQAAQRARFHLALVAVNGGGKVDHMGAPTHEIERQGRWKQGGGMVGRYTRGESAGSALRYL